MIKTLHVKGQKGDGKKQCRMNVLVSGTGRAHLSMPSPILPWLLEIVGAIHLVAQNGLWASKEMGKPGLLHPWLQRNENGKKASLAHKETQVPGGGVQP